MCGRCPASYDHCGETSSIKLVFFESQRSSLMISVKDQYESTFSGRSYLMNKIPASDIFQYQRLSTANSELPTALQETFDKLADETIAWSRYYYGPIPF
jgi:hypothetical protein